MAHLGDRSNRIGEGGHLKVWIVFDGRKQHCRARHFEEGCHFGHVGITRDYVQAPISRCVTVGFVAGVHDRAADSGLKSNFLFKKISSLRDLIIDSVGRHAMKLTTNLS